VIRSSQRMRLSSVVGGSEIRIITNSICHSPRPFEDKCIFTRRVLIPSTTVINCNYQPQTVLFIYTYTLKIQRLMSPYYSMHTSHGAGPEILTQVEVYKFKTSFSLTALGLY
jgi:hypothetical protein